MLDILRYPQCLWQPEYHSDIPWWHGHIPFAFFLIAIHRPRVFVELGSHKGDSYMAFCQAVVGTGLTCSCRAVDNWQGDQHVGDLADEIYTNLKTAHDPKYSAFSQLMRMDFNEALAEFRNGTIDLLHIDGTHTYDAVKRDFENWLPKVSDRGVIIMHDIAARPSSFGVMKVWDELTERFPRHLAFKHSAGLGVLGVGSDLPDAVVKLLELPPQEKATVQQLFEQLGTALSSRIDPPEKVEMVRKISQPRPKPDKSSNHSGDQAADRAAGEPAG